MSCHAESSSLGGTATPLIILAGQPNVGKSVLFKHLTGRYVTVSNYPGTTVEVAQGQATLAGQPTTILDAPGINSLLPQAEDERVTRRLLLTERPQAVVQVADAKNLARALCLTLQLAELDARLVLDVNMTDEAEQRGLHIDYPKLAERLGVEVVPTIAPRGVGVGHLIESLAQPHVPRYRVTYPAALEAALIRVEGLLPLEAPGRRGRALMLLVGDETLAQEMGLDALPLERLREMRDQAQAEFDRPLAQVITHARWQAALALVAEVCARQGSRHQAWRDALGRLAVHPVFGWPILFAILFLVYKFVGEFGAGTLVDGLEGTVFQAWLIPGFISLLDKMPLPALARDFLVGEYGLVTMGLSYGLGIVLPIVSTFFLAFGLLEDSGYLPRLTVMVNRSFKVIGLNGKAVLPMVLGLGCVTMATMTTRILGTRKERLLATLLLALSIPCSAQLGVILAMVSWLTLPAVLVWIGLMVAILLAVGWLAARVIPGETSNFLMELPPLRWPAWDNILLKTLARVEWYLKEVIPLFALATVALFALDRTGVLDLIQRLGSPLVVGWLGLPPETAGVFLLGFLRRDYGAVGLFEMARSGLLTPHQVFVSLMVITLFVPCVATVMMIVKEHGVRVTLAIVAFVFPFAFLVGGLAHRLVGG